MDFKPTWRNGRVGLEGIGKRMNIFFMVENLVSIANMFRTWIVSSKIYDHFPVVLQIESGLDRIKYPFHFNLVWLAKKEFENLVRSHWNSLRGEESTSPISLLVNKFKSLKSAMIKWEKNCKKELKKYMCHIEEELEKVYAQNGCGVFTMQEKMLIQDLEHKKLIILRKGAETWKQKSRVVWLAPGDANTKKITSMLIIGDFLM